MIAYDIKRMHNMPKPKLGIDELKKRLIDTLDRIPQGVIDKASGKHGCMHVTSNAYCDIQDYASLIF